MTNQGANQGGECAPTGPDGTASKITVSGCDVHFSRHGPADRPSLILLHCGGGHRGWWTGVTPALTALFEVINVDLSGHGESGHRDAYTPELWAAEISAVAGHASAPAPTVVGHSMGGLAAIYCAALYPQSVGQLILIDPPVSKVFIRDLPPGSRTYATPEDALRRFKLRPPETIADAALLQQIGRIGLKPVQGGWAWRYDPRASQRYSVEGLKEMLAQISCPVGCIYGSRSQYVDEGTVQYIEDILHRPVPAAVIDGAFHHVPLDEPVATAAAILKIHRDLSTAIPA